MAVVMNKGEGARRWFETMYDAGKGVAEGIKTGKRLAAGQKAAAAQKAAIPVRGTIDQGEVGAPQAVGGNVQQQAQLDDQWAPDSTYIPQANAELNLKYGHDLSAYIQRKQDNLDEYAGHVELEDMVKIEEAYDKKTAKQFQNGLLTTGQMIERGGDPQAIADSINNTYALKPTGNGSVATVTPEGVVMSFFDESTGRTKATVPVNDAQALYKMAAAYDNPEYAATFGLKLKELGIAEKELGLKRQKLKDDKLANQSVFAGKVLTSSSTFNASAAKQRGTRTAAENKRLDRLEDDIRTMTKEEPMSPETNGSYYRQIATASDFGAYNPTFTAAQSIDALRKLDAHFMPRVHQYMEAHPELKPEFEKSGYEIPQVVAQAAYDMLKRNKVIQVDEDNPNASYFRDGKRQIRIPPMVSGAEGYSDEAYGYTYGRAQGMGGSITDNGVDPTLLGQANRFGVEYLGGTPDAASAVVRSGAIPTPGLQAPPAVVPPAVAPPVAEDGVRPFDAKAQQEVMSTLLLALRQQDGAAMASFIMKVKSTYGQAAAQQVANEAEEMIGAIDATAPVPPPTVAAPKIYQRKGIPLQMP